MGDQSPAANTTRFRTAIVSAVVLTPLLWWVWTACFSDVAMLLPSGCGAWVVHPDWDVRASPEISYPPVMYRLEVPAEALSSRPVAEITVMGSFRVRLGTKECGGFGPDRGTWRRPVSVDLASCAAADPAPRTTLELLIVAQNDKGPAPARVCWRGEASLPSTGDKGWSALSPDRRWRPAAIAGRGNSEMLDKDFAWRGGPVGYLLLLATVLLLTTVALVRRAQPERTTLWTDSEVPSLVVLVVIAAIYFWNAYGFPWQVSHLDQQAHAERLRYAAEHLIPAPADSSFQAYQPPLYYAAAGGLIALTRQGDDLLLSDDPEDLRPAQIFNAVAGLGHVLLAWWFLRRYGPTSQRARAWSLAIVGLAPVALSTYPMLGNETLAGFLCGAALVSGVSCFTRTQVSRAVGAGLVAALALLTKYTGLMPVAALSLVFLARGLDARVGFASQAPVKPQKRASPSFLVRLSAWCLPILLLAGPFYIRRWLTWGHAFIGNWHPSLGFRPVAEPGYRTLGFFFRFGEVFFYAPERGLWSSFWDGLYASTWGEINDSFLPIGDAAIKALLLVLLAFAIVPTAACIHGLLATARRATQHRPGMDLACLALTTFSVAAVAVFTLQVPYITTVKALFLLSLSLPAALFTARGFARMERGLRTQSWLLDLVTVLQLLLIFRLFIWHG